MKKVATEAIGYQSLKDKQREVIVNFVKGNDVFAVLPTGYGKGLYAIPVYQKYTTAF